MKIRTRILLPFLLTTVTASVVAFFALDRGFQAQMVDGLKEVSLGKVRAIQQEQKRVADRCLSCAALFSRTPAVQQAFALAHAGDLLDEDDSKANEARTLLRRELASFAEGYKANMDGRSLKLHFHLPNGRSLLRFWRASQTKSDDLSGFRQTVLDINQGTHEPIAGIEVGRGGFAIRGIAPVVGPDGEHLGSVEVLSDFLPVVQNAKWNDDENLAVYMKADLLTVATKLSDKEKYPRIDDQFVRIMSTNDEQTAALINLECLVKSLLGVNTGQKEVFQITAFPVMDYVGKPIGVITYVADMSGKLARQASIRWGLSIGISVLALVLTVVSLWVARSITRPLNKVVLASEALADGIYDRKADVRSNGEIGQMASAVNASIDAVAQAMQEVKAAAERERELERQRTEEHRIAAEREQQLEEEKARKERQLVEEDRKKSEVLREKIDSLLRVVAAAAEGDLTNQVTQKGDEAIDELAVGIQKMLNDLSSVIHQVTESAGQFNDGSLIITESSQALAHGSQTQSASVEEISASVEELTASINGVNTLAIEADAMATKANGLAKRGGTAVHKSIEAIEAIRDSSSQVGEITQVISEIASQTNLLALNAAIEAARAGEHGLGFAVVADEVRKLAGRSNEAAGKISTLIQASSQLVQDGVKRSDDTDAALKEILIGVEETVGKISQIAVITVEQTDNAKQVAEAVQSISQVTESSAASSEEMASNSEQLGTQAWMLKDLVARFKTNDIQG